MWGSNDYGQLGVSANNTITRKEPVKITANFDEKIVSLEAGFYHSLALSITGRIYTFGWNQYGQLGDGTNVMKTVPVEITSRLEGRVVSLSAGHSHNLALTSTGHLYAWGSNDHGQLGDATTVAKNSPVEITSYFSEKIVFLASGFYFNLALSENNLVFAWGSNDYGQLGDNTKTKRLIAIEISSRFNGIVTSVYAGQYHSLALTSNNDYYAWGYNSNGQFGDGSTTNRFVPLKIEDVFYDFVVYFVEHYDFGSSINNIQEPSKPGYIFHGWYNDKDFLAPYTFSVMPNDNIILYGYFSRNS